MVYMLGADWQADITHLVLDQLKVGPHILTYTHIHSHVHQIFLEGIVQHFGKYCIYHLYNLLSKS